jgi:hypothetical protein
MCADHADRLTALLDAHQAEPALAPRDKRPPADAKEWACPDCGVDVLWYRHRDGCTYEAVGSASAEPARETTAATPPTPADIRSAISRLYWTIPPECPDARRELRELESLLLSVTRLRREAEARETPPPTEDESMIEQFCRDLNAAHNEILKLQGCDSARFNDFDWPSWSAQANSLRWASRRLGKRVGKTDITNDVPQSSTRGART